MNGGAEVIVQWGRLNEAGDVQSLSCVTFNGTSVTEPAQIAIIGENGREQDASDLHQAVLTRITEIFSQGGNACSGPAFLGCRGRQTNEATSILVPLLTDQQMSAGMERLVKKYLFTAPGIAVGDIRVVDHNVGRHERAANHYRVPRL